MIRLYGNDVRNAAALLFSLTSSLTSGQMDRRAAELRTLRNYS